MKKNLKKIYLCSVMRAFIYVKKMLMCKCINKIRLFVALFVIMFASMQILWAQDAALRFDTVKWDFGEIVEDAGSVEHTFNFQNISSAPVVILNVKSSCGCTTTEYSRKPIKAGEKGSIKVVFDPVNRPGHFRKAIKISTSAAEQPMEVEIEGVVIPRKKSVEEEYPFDLGEGVRLTSNFHAFAYVGRGEAVKERIGWVNTSNRDAELRFIPKESSGLLQIDKPDVLPAGGRGEIYIIYSIAKDSERYGTLSDVFDVEVNGVPARTLFSTHVIAVDAFDRANDDITAPIARISKKFIKFAEVKHSTTVIDNTLEIVNDGESDLIIRAIEWKSAALKCNLKAGDRLKPGAKVRLELSLDTSDCDYGVFTDRIRIITNDCRNPMQSVRVTAIVVQ